MNIDEWAASYCSEKGITYEELSSEALRYYRFYVQNETTINFLTGREFSNFISNLNSMLSKLHEDWNVLEVRNPEEKDMYVRTINKSMQSILEAEGSMLISVMNKNDIYARAVVSFEEDENGNSAFLHTVDLTNKDYSKDYNRVLFYIERFLKRKGKLYMDRNIRDASIQDIEKKGYFILFENLGFKIKLPQYENKDYVVSSNEKFDNEYIPAFKILPERFNFNDHLLIKLIRDKVEFFAAIDRKKDTAAVKLYFLKSKINDIYYKKSCMDILMNYCYMNGINILFTTILKEHKIVLEEYMDVLEYVRFTYIRKPL